MRQYFGMLMTVLVGMVGVVMAGGMRVFKTTAFDGLPVDLGVKPDIKAPVLKADPNLPYGDPNDYRSYALGYFDRKPANYFGNKGAATAAEKKAYYKLTVVRMESPETHVSVAKRVSNASMLAAELRSKKLR